MWIDDIQINDIPAAPSVANVTLKIHEYNGNYTTSPLIEGIASIGGTNYTISNNGSTYSINKGTYDPCYAYATGYDTTYFTRTIDADTTIDIYLLRQNYVTVDYSIVDSITGALVTAPALQIYDTVTGTRTNYTDSLGSVTVLRDHLIYFNATKTGYGPAIQNYTFTGATQVRLYLISPLVAPEGMTFVTFHVRDHYGSIYTGIGGVDVLINGQHMTTDESGLATTLINSTTGAYGWTASKVGYYPATGSYGLNSVQGNIVDVQLTKRTNGTTVPGQVDTEQLNAYHELVDGTVGTITDIFTGGIDILVIPVDILNDSITTIGTSVDDGMGFADNSTNVFADLFGVIVFGLPWQVKGLITYYLAWLLALMFLNR